MQAGGLLCHKTDPCHHCGNRCNKRASPTSRCQFSRALADISRRDTPPFRITRTPWRSAPLRTHRLRNASSAPASPHLDASAGCRCKTTTTSPRSISRASPRRVEISRCATPPTSQTTRTRPDATPLYIRKHLARATSQVSSLRESHSRQGLAPTWVALW